MVALLHGIIFVPKDAEVAALSRPRRNDVKICIIPPGALCLVQTCEQHVAHFGAVQIRVKHLSHKLSGVHKALQIKLWVGRERGI